jgi:hypothetical protein
MTSTSPTDGVLIAGVILCLAGIRTGVGLAIEPWMRRRYQRGRTTRPDSRRRERR